MSLVLLSLVGGWLVGRARGGSLYRLAHLRLPGWPLVAAAFALQVVALLVSLATGDAPRSVYVLAVAASAALALGFTARNRHLRGMPMVALGLAMNAGCVLANGAMPVSMDAAERAGITTVTIVAGVDPRHEVADRSTKLRPLGDVIPVPLPVGSQVVSPGDVILAAGLAVLIANGMVRPGPGRQARRFVQREAGQPA